MIETVYIYVDGCDLAEISGQLIHRIEQFSEPFRGLLRLVDQRGEIASDDLPDWDLGVNFDINALTDDEAKHILLFFQSLTKEFSRDFVLGSEQPTGLGEDLFAITATGSIEEALAFLTSP
jgi:hypothetical protein